MADGDFNSVVTTDLPDWYKQYTQNMAGQAMGLAQNLNSQPLPAASVAGFNADQLDAFGNVRENQDIWQPQLNYAGNTNAQIVPTANTFVNAAQDAASGSAGNWTNEYQKYMSPYTTAVVDNIARLGKRNWEESIMPSVNSSMIGSGQFGSTRNADILTQAGLKANADILGQQTGALEAGWNTGAGIFANDANRAQTQQQMQVNAALNGGTALTNAQNTAVDNAGALSQMYQTQAQTDVNNLMGVGNAQQALQQKGLDTAFSNANLARTDPWTQLNNANTFVNNVKLPAIQTTASSGQQGAAPSTGATIGSGLLTLAGILGK